MASSGPARVSMGSMQELEDLFNSHVERCSMHNWKYWMFSLMMHPLLPSFKTNVKAGSFEEMARSTTNWVDQHLSLVQLRPILLSALKELCTSTEILDKPDLFPEEAVRAAAKARLKRPLSNEGSMESPEQQVDYD